MNIGLYIPDLRLPVEGDFELWIAVRKDGSFTYNVRGGWQDGKQKAIPIPPHGDLIDRDALLEGEGRYLISFGKEGIDITEILRAKTIIPASEEE